MLFPGRLTNYRAIRDLLPLWLVRCWAKGENPFVPESSVTALLWETSEEEEPTGVEGSDGGVCTGLGRQSHSGGLEESCGASALSSGGGERWDICRGRHAASKGEDQDTVASCPRTHCLESDGRRQLMTLGQAFFLCEDEVGGPGGERGKVEPVGSPGSIRVCPGSGQALGLQQGSIWGQGGYDVSPWLKSRSFGSRPRGPVSTYAHALVPSQTQLGRQRAGSWGSLE